MPARGQVRSLVGLRSGRLSVLSYVGQDRHRRSQWRCLCDCGRETTVSDTNLKNGTSTSCGCFKSEVTADRNRTHGEATGRGTPEYRSWAAMHARVKATTGVRYRLYGSRGITVCEMWNSFESFLADMGRRPPGTSIDRIDNDGNYEPGNCRWATPSQQNANQRRSLKYKAGRSTGA